MVANVIVSSLLAALLGGTIGSAGFAQTPPNPPAPAPQSQTPPAAPPASAAPAAQDPKAPAGKDAPATTAQGTPQGDKPAFKQEEIEQILSPIALYPDSLVSQILMASTYPLEIVEAERWLKANKQLKDDALAKALEQQKWDASVKSLVAVPPVLEMLSMKLDWTQKLGDAFISQQKQVMDGIQSLRAKAKESGALDKDKNMKVETKQEGSTEIIIIESADPKVVYVPTYDPVVVYSGWAYPAYPPYPYYPPGYYPGAAFATFAVGVAWGYAWGNCNWGGSDVDIDINRNTNINNNIDRSKYQKGAGTDRSGKGSFKHDPSHRKNVPYRDSGTAKKFGGVSTADSARARSDYRGRTNGGTDLSRAGSRPSAGASDRAGARPGTGSTRPSAGASTRAGTSNRTNSGALGGVKNGGATTRAQSARGSASRGASRGGGGGGGRRR